MNIIKGFLGAVIAGVVLSYTIIGLLYLIHGEEILTKKIDSVDQKLTTDVSGLSIRIDALEMSK